MINNVFSVFAAIFFDVEVEEPQHRNIVVSSPEEEIVIENIPPDCITDM